MKTLVFSLILAGVLLTTGAFANPRNNEKSKAKPAVRPTATVEQQLASHLTYPDALLQAKGNGVVVIQFKLDQKDRLTDLTIHSADKALNQELTNQLKHVRLTTNAADPDQVYTAQLRFRASE